MTAEGIVAPRLFSAVIDRRYKTDSASIPMRDSSRILALAALKRWRHETEFADHIVAEAFAQTSLGASDRAFALELFYGVLRNLTLLDFWLAQLRSARIDATVRDILRLGFYQIMFLKTAPHAAVFETVELARQPARKLVNAILRRALRENNALTNRADSQPLSIRFSEPEFLIEKWSRQFGVQTTFELCHWNNQPAPIYGRVNQLQITVAQFLERYPDSFLLPESANFVGLCEPGVAVQSGDCYIQDPSTAIACELLGPSRGGTVLDACAAPGGKSAYLAEMMANEGILWAIDRDERRLSRLRDNLDRLGVANARVLRCDWSDESSVRSANFEKHVFDKILVDAPCTNTGVMRRRVDVRWRLRPNDFARQAREQLAILEAVAPFLKPGGSLVYSTCSLEREENENVIAAFLHDHPEFRLTKSEQSLPFRDGIDGAFAAQLSLSS